MSLLLSFLCWLDCVIVVTIRAELNWIISKLLRSTSKLKDTAEALFWNTSLTFVFDKSTFFQNSNQKFFVQKHKKVCYYVLFIFFLISNYRGLLYDRSTSNIHMICRVGCYLSKETPCFEIC